MLGARITQLQLTNEMIIGSALPARFGRNEFEQDLAGYQRYPKNIYPAKALPYL